MQSDRNGVTLGDVFTLVPVILILVGGVTYSNRLQAQIDVLTVRQDAIVTTLNNNISTIKDDIKELKDVLRIRK